MQTGKGLGGKVGRKQLCCSESGKHNIYLFCHPTWDKFVGELPSSLSLSFKSGSGGWAGVRISWRVLKPWKANKREIFLEICNYFILEDYVHFSSWVLNFGLSHIHCSDCSFNLHPYKWFLCSYIFFCYFSL